MTIAIGAIAFLGQAESRWRHDQKMFWIDIGLGLLSLVAYQFRRRQPFAVAFFTNAVGAMSGSAAGPGVMSLISLSTRRQWREMLPLAAVSIAVRAVYFQISPVKQDPWYVNLGFSVVGTVVCIAIGMYVGARRELLATLEDRADRAEREQAMRVREARTNERASIAREMHDVLAHRISLVAMHAGALAYRTDLSAGETKQTAEIIQSNAHRALGDLREILGLLRRGDHVDAVERPQPTLSDIVELIEEERNAGGHVRLFSTVDPLTSVPDTIGRSAYRMVQESLTNARKHAPDTTVEVYLSGDPGEALKIEVRNPLRTGSVQPSTPGAGLGLIGLAERAALSGGRLEHELTTRGDFVLRAWLPWPS